MPHPQYPITSIDTENNNFIITGNPTDILVADTVAVVGSTANDGNYTVANTGNGFVRVVETIPDPTGDGTLQDTALSPSTQVSSAISVGLFIGLGG